MGEVGRFMDGKKVGVERFRSWKGIEGRVLGRQSE